MRDYIATVLLSILLIARPVQADLLSGCIVGYDFGNILQQTINLYPVNPDCASSCRTNCNATFSHNSNAGIELNADIIDRCQSFCQSGESFSSYYRIDTGITDDYGNVITSLSGPSSISSVCSQADGKVWARAVRSSITFSPGDSIAISMAANEYNNKIYGCGKDNINIIPLYNTDNNEGWTASNVQTLWKNTYDHYCLNYLNQATGSGQTQVIVGNLQVGNLVNVPTTCNPGDLCYAFVMDPLMINGAYTAIPIDDNNNSLPSSNFTTLAPNVPGQPFQYTDSTAANNPGLYRRINDLVNWYNDDGGYTISQQSGTRNLSGPCRFSVLEENMIDTGLRVQNGDELAISWQGNFNTVNNPVDSTVFTSTSPYLMTQTQRAMAARNLALSSSNPISTAITSSFTLSSIGVNTTANINSYINTCKTILEDNSGIEIYFNNTLRLLSGESARIVPLCVPRSLTASNSSATTVLGLKGTVNDNARCNFGYTSQYNVDNNITTNSSCSIQSSSDLANGACYFISSMDDSQYSYAGILSGEASTRSRLAIRMKDSATTFEDNAGGVSVNIAWGGCPASDGGNTQYFISTCNLDALKLDDSYPWVTFHKGTIFPQSISVPTTATSTAAGIYVSSECGGDQYYIYMRIYDPYISQTYISTTDSFSNIISAPQSNLTNLYGGPGNRYGSYSIQLKKMPPVTFSGQYNYTVQIENTNKPGLLQKLAKFIMQTVVGTQNLGYTDGILRSSYEAITSGNSYLSALRAMLVMYVAFLALSFIMGLSDFTQKEAVSHLLKMGFIASITSGQSWEFFGTYILPAVVNGSATLAAMVSSNGFTEADQVRLNEDPTYLLAYIDQLISSLWSRTMWLKCLALVFSSFWGVIFGMLLFFALIIYTIGLLKVVMVYCFSIIGLGFFIFLAPVTIPMFLFKFTEPIFEKWWKGILSYAVQPIMLFASVCILNFLAMTILYATLNYSICPVCFVRITFMGFEWCPLEIYLNNETLHAGNNSDGKIGPFLMQSSIILLTLSYLMFEMASVFTSIAHKLITGGEMGGNAGSTADQAASSMGVGSVGQAMNTAKSGMGNVSRLMSKSAKGEDKKDDAKSDTKGDTKARPGSAKE